jgi:hypothetical protein
MNWHFVTRRCRQLFCRDRSFHTHHLLWMGRLPW